MLYPWDSSEIPPVTQLERKNKGCWYSGGSSFMKRVLWMVLLTLALPVAAFAGSVDFSAQSGTLSGGNGGLTLSGEQVLAISGLTTPSPLTGLNLASVAFTTGAFLTGSAVNGGTFSGTGSSFTITAENIPGIANGTTIFTGMFTCTSGCTWTLSDPSNPNGNHQYTLYGTISGTWYNGMTVNGVTTQTTIDTGKGLFDGSAAVVSGDTSFTTTPEPGSLMLMGTGLIGLGGVLRRKLKA